MSWGKALKDSAGFRANKVRQLRYSQSQSDVGALSENYLFDGMTRQRLDEMVLFTFLISGMS